MTKLGSDWHVPQKIAGKKRKPEEVAKDLEKEFTDTAQRLLQKAKFFTAKHSAAKTAHEFCSNGETGLTGFAENTEEVLESQKRGFGHRHFNVNTWQVRETPASSSSAQKTS